MNAVKGQNILLVMLLLLGTFATVQLVREPVNSPRFLRAKDSRNLWNNTLKLKAKPLPKTAVASPLTQLPNGTDLRSLTVRGKKLKLERGEGHAFTSSDRARYHALKAIGQRQKNARIQWALMNLDNEEIIHKSRQPALNFYGASVSKIYIGAGILHKQKGKLSKGQLQELADMVVVSSNRAWGSLQRQTGNGSERKGQEYIQQFTKKLGHKNAIAFRGWMDRLHGNEVSARDMVQLLADTYKQRFEGAETLWKVMHATRTGKTKGLKYLPKSMNVGGKTGTYRGYTVHPQTQKPYRANVHHHAMIFKHDGTQYGLVVMTDQSTNEEVALLTAGVVQESLGILKQ